MFNNYSTRVKWIQKWVKPDWLRIFNKIYVDTKFWAYFFIRCHKNNLWRSLNTFFWPSQNWQKFHRAIIDNCYVINIEDLPAKIWLFSILHSFFYEIFYAYSFRLIIVFKISTALKLFLNIGIYFMQWMIFFILNFDFTHSARFPRF